VEMLEATRLRPSTHMARTHQRPKSPSKVRGFTRLRPSTHMARTRQRPKSPSKVRGILDTFTFYSQLSKNIFCYMWIGTSQAF